MQCIPALHAHTHIPTHTTQTKQGLLQAVDASNTSTSPSTSPSTCPEGPPPQKKQAGRQNPVETTYMPDSALTDT